MNSTSKAIGWVQKLHAHGVLPGRFHRLVELIDAEIPSRAASLLDVGAGSGTIAHRLKERHADWRVEGVDVLRRPQTLIPVHPFNGLQLPFADQSFDIVLLIDVLHHASDPRTLLAECVRVASRRVLIKDHCQRGWLDRAILRGMDWVGNASYGVALRGRYLSDAQWTDLYRTLPVEVLQRKFVDVHAFPFSALTGRHLQTLHTLRPLAEKGPSA